MSEENLLSKVIVEDMNQVMMLVQNFSDSYCYTIDMTENEAWFNNGVENEFPLPGSHFKNCSEELLKVSYESDRKALKDELDACASGRLKFHNMIYRWYDHGHNAVWIECRGYCVTTADGHRVLIGRTREIGRRQIADDITGLQREVLFQQKIQPMLADCPEKIRYFIRFGIDNLKEINEKDGTAAGDEVLREAADIMLSAAEGKADMYRLVADEFMMVVMADADLPAPRTMYDRVSRKIQSAIKKRNYSRTYTISAGTLQDNLSGITYEEIMNDTEFAMFQAKRNGRDQMVFFSQPDYRKYIKNIHTREVLRQSIRDGFKGFEVFYQPIISENGCKLEGAEALLRYKDPDGNNIAPVDMIPILEESSMIIPVGAFVLDDAARTCSEWRKLVPNFKINVNLSYVQIMQSKINAELNRVFEKYKLDADSLMMEVTESGYIQSDMRCMSLFKEFERMNVSVAIDDFGTGYSNLRYIRDMNASVVKIDSSFVSQALNDGYDFIVLKNIIKMIHDVGMRVCIEGVEQQEELERLGKMEPDYIQGYLFGRLSPRNVFETDFLRMGKDS